MAVDWDALAASTPHNSTAARVVSQGGTHYEPTLGEQPHTFRSDIRPPVKAAPPHDSIPHVVWKELKGARIGRLVVLGIADLPKTSKRTGKRARWVVRCDCGWYENRSAQALRAAKNGERGTSDQGRMCRVCARQETLKRQYAEQGARPLGAFLLGDSHNM